jgi:hypothetical protein
MRNSKIDQTLLNIAEYANKKSKSKGFTKHNVEFSYGIFMKEINNLLNSLNLSEEQLKIIESIELKNEF